MKDTLNRLFSFSEAETECINQTQDKIELVSCPRKKMICQKHLSVVNNCFALSEQYFRDKEFQMSVETLKSAFYETTELDELPCSNCAKLFRSTITETVKSMHLDLEKMTSGFFGNKSYKPSIQILANVLNEFEKVELHELYKANKEKSRFLGEYLKKQVS